jgi:hypothetical protein
MPSLRDDSLFDRLGSLPFVESAHDGLMMHDAVREAIRTDLEAIDPPICQRYRRAAWQQLNHEAKSAAAGNPWRYSADLIFLINNPAIREAFFPKDVAKFYVERAGAGDGAEILSIATEHEGRQAAQIVEGWWIEVRRLISTSQRKPRFRAASNAKPAENASRPGRHANESHKFLINLSCITGKRHLRSSCNVAGCAARRAQPQASSRGGKNNRQEENENAIGSSTID